MKRILYIGCIACLLALLWGCGTQPEPARVIFERGHGSQWGNQLYVDVTQEQILLLKYVDADTGELVTEENLPIRQEQWQQLVAALQSVQLKRARLWKAASPVDGTLYRKLTVIDGSGKEVSYRWPANGQTLEEILESLAKTRR